MRVNTRRMHQKGFAKNFNNIENIDDLECVFFKEL